MTPKELLKKLTDYIDSAISSKILANKNFQEDLCNSKIETYCLDPSSIDIIVKYNNVVCIYAKTTNPYLKQKLWELEEENKLLRAAWVKMDNRLFQLESLHPGGTHTI